MIQCWKISNYPFEATISWYLRIDQHLATLIKTKQQKPFCVRKLIYFLCAQIKKCPWIPAVAAPNRGAPPPADPAVARTPAVARIRIPAVRRRRRSQPRTLPPKHNNRTNNKPIPEMPPGGRLLPPRHQPPRRNPRKVKPF